MCSRLSIGRIHCSLSDGNFVEVDLLVHGANIEDEKKQLHNNGVARLSFGRTTILQGENSVDPCTSPSLR
jgi:hypothetical protein